MPSWRQVSVSVIGAAGAMTLLASAVFAVAGATESSTPWMAPILFAVMVMFWAPATLWSSWWVTVPVVAVTGLAAALLIHRYQLLQPQHAGMSLRRPVIRACVGAALMCGAWSLAIGVFALIAVLHAA